MSQNIKKHYIFIDKKKLVKGEANPSKIIGSIRQLVNQKIIIDNEVVKYDKLYNLLGYEKYFNNDDYYIRQTEIERSKRKINKIY